METSKIKLVFVSIFILLFSCQKKDTNDLTKLNLLGRVKSLTLSNFETVERFGVIRKGKLLSKVIFIFSEFGNKTNSSSRYNGVLSDSVVYKYDSNGLGLIDFYFDSAKVLYRKATYKYDEKGNLIDYSSYNILDSILDSKTIFKYDEKGNPIEDCVYNPDSTLLNKYLSEYDKKGNLIKNEQYDSIGNLVYGIIHKYDIKNNRISDEYYPKDEIKVRILYKYDAFDKNGNWIRKLIYEKGIPKRIIQRDIEYYE